VNQALTIVEPRRPVLALKITSGQVSGTIQGDPDQAYQVRVSANLTDWGGVADVTTDTTGFATWADSTPLSERPRFYGAVKP
jgi:hypothetical protein